VIPIVIFANILLAFKLVIISIIVSFVVYWIYRQIRLANELISILPTLLKEISDYMRLGYNIKFSFKKVDVNASSRVQRILEEISKEFTVKNEVTEVKTPSKLFNIIIQILSLFEKSGISYEAMDELSSLVNDLLSVRLSLIRQLRLFDLMVILTPIMLWLTFSMMGNISGSNNVTLFSVLMFSYSLASSVIFSKLSRFTIFYLPTILSGIIMALILSFLPHVIFI
jgi:flagellar protein FlaJ